MNHQRLTVGSISADKLTSGSVTITSSVSPSGAMAAIQAVLDLHSPEYSDLERRDYPYCPVCEFDNMNIDWPCPTVKAITGALGGGEGDE